jgi:hypothetical protein
MATNTQSNGAAPMDPFQDSADAGTDAEELKITSFVNYPVPKLGPEIPYTNTTHSNPSLNGLTLKYLATL